MLVTAASVGLTPLDFWGRPDDVETGFDLYEFDLYVQGHAKKTERDQELLAWHAANVMSMHAKKGSRITADKLLGREKAAMDPRILKEHLDKEAEAKREREVSTTYTQHHYDPEQDRADFDAWTKRVLASREREADDDDQSDSVDGAEA